MSEYGAEAWKLHNTVLQQMYESAQKQLVELRSELLAIPIIPIIFFYGNSLCLLQAQFGVAVDLCRKKVQEINWQRKTEQSQAGETLRNLEER